MEKFLESCELNLSWMRNSGIMSQGDGEWGVAERLVTTGGNAAMDKIRHSFPAISEHEGYVIVEQRRSDCNFEAALLFALHGQFHHDSSSETTAKNLLDFLFFRSGLLNRTDETSVIGAWNWSHIQRRYGLWFDDDGWVAAMELVLARLFPHLDERYQLREWGRLQALDLLKAFKRTFTAAETPREKYTDPKAVYQGQLELPHWAVPTLCALVMLAKEPDTDQETGRQVDAQLDAYLQFAFSRMDTFNGSELGYLTILGALLNWNGNAPQPHRRLLEEAVLRIQNRIDGIRHPPRRALRGPHGTRKGRFDLHPELGFPGDGAGRLLRQEVPANRTFPGRKTRRNAGHIPRHHLPRMLARHVRLQGTDLRRRKLLRGRRGKHLQRMDQRTHRPGNAPA